MNCPKCGYDNREGVKFCEGCGERMPSICPKCGSDVRTGARFCGECGAKLIEEASSLTETAAPTLEDMHTQLQSLIPDELAQKYMAAEQQATGENRPITALFADISGFTPLSNTQSSETMFQLVQDSFKRLVGVVARYEGSISGFRGDGLLALFGAPILHENDAERAILAAINMHDAMQEQGLQVSIGVNTAMMTVGEIQTQLHKEYTAYGTDINLAKRLQEAADPGQILAGTGTHRLTRRIFDFEAVHELSVKGFQESVTAYIVQQVKEHPEKLRGIEGLRARMIGREHEFADLKDAADAWLGGQGQIVSIIGEAGIGKSRLVQELRASLSPRPPVSLSILEGRCVSIGQPISYWPFLDILRAYLGLNEDDAPADIARKLTKAVTQLMPQGADEALPLLGNLLSVKFGNELDDRLKFAGPEQIRHQTLMRLRDFFDTLAKQKPLLLILEDLHWADDLSLDLISLLMDELANTPLMLLCVYRPEKEHRVWQLSNQARRKCLDRYTELTLNPLSSHQGRLLVESLLTIDNLPENVRDTILTKSEGNPFFIEEVIRSLIEQDVVYREDDRWKARDEIASINVPDTIQSVVLARVDRLQSEAKYVLQCASVIGRLFRYRLLQHLSRQERDLDGYLSDFEEKELVYEERTVPELEYAFKHAFTQEATYQGILEQRRQEYHHQVAEGIERLYQERIDEYYEELAHHYSRSGDTEKAVEYLLKSGEKAKVTYDNQAAISYFQQALDALEQHEMERNDWKLDALRGLGEIYIGTGKIIEAIEVFEKAMVLGKRINLDPRQLASIYRWNAESFFWLGQYDKVVRYGEMGLELLGDDTESAAAAQMNCMIALGAEYAGNHEKAMEYNCRNISFVNRLDYSMELAGVYNFIIGGVLGYDKNPAGAWKWTEELERRAKEYNELEGLSVVWRFRSLILQEKGDYQNAISSIQKALDINQRKGYDRGMSTCHWITAELLFGLGDLDTAMMHVKASMELFKNLESAFLGSSRYEQLGHISMSKRDWDKAISYYQKSLDSDGISAKSYLTLGKIYLKTGDYHKAIQFFEKTDDINALGWMEEAYMALGTPEQYIEFCRSSDQWQHDRRQLHLESTKTSAEFPHFDISDEFNTETIESSWNWLDEFRDCSYRIFDEGGLEICATNGRDIYELNISAPRLMRDTSGNFAVEVNVSPAANDKPHIGGLLIWKDKYNFLRFDMGEYGPCAVRLQGYVDGEHQVAGRGLLPSSGETSLRLEHSGDEFTSYCSADGENWFTCGKITMPVDDPIQIGIHAIGMIDRTIYCGAYKEGTATVFRNFRIYRHD